MRKEYNAYEEYGGGMPDDTIRPSQFKRNLSILRRHIWVIVAVFAIVATIGVLRAYRAAPHYWATAKILVERQGPHFTQFQDVVNGAPAWGPEYYKTQLGIMTSRAVLELALEDPEIRGLFERTENAHRKKSLRAKLRRTIPALLGIPPTAPSEPWERLRAYVSPKHVTDTSFIQVRINDGDPERAAKLANAVAGAFIKYHIVRRMEISNDVFVYLERQKDQEEMALQQAHRRLHQFREDTKISTLDSSSDHPVLMRLSMLNNQLTRTQLERIEAESQYRVAQHALDSDRESLHVGSDQIFSLTSLLDDETASSIRESLVLAENELSSMGQIYGPLHPRLKSVESRVQHLRGKLRSTMQEVVTTLSTQLEMLEQEEGELRRQYDEQNVSALNLAKQSLTFKSHEMDVQRHQRLLEVLIQRMSEVEITSDYTRTNVELIERASVPKAPSGPDKKRMASLSLLFGLLLGVGMAMFLERIDDTVRTPDDIEMNVGISVLGFVPEIKAKKSEQDNRAYRGLVSVLEPSSSALEAYRNIRTSLFFSAPAEDAKVLLVTSAGPGDGKTTTASNLALVIAQTGKRVLLIDADFRRPKVHKIFGLNDEIGFSSVLVGEATLDDAVQKTAHDIENIDKLDIIAAGPTPPNPTELFETKAARRVIEGLRDKYDRIIIDTPPVLFVSDATILSSLGDGVVIVGRAGKNTTAAMTRAKKQLETGKARIVGGILNDVKVSRLGHYYSDYYYYGHAKYHRDYYGSYYSRDDKPKKSGRNKTAGV